MKKRQARLIENMKRYVGLSTGNIEQFAEIKSMFDKIYGRNQKEPFCVGLVQHCVREVDKEFGGSTVLFATESSQILWMKTPKVARLTKPEPGCLAVWQRYQNGLPLSQGHIGVVTKVLNGGDLIETVEGHVPDNLDSINWAGERVSIKQRPAWLTIGPLRTTGFLMAWPY